MPRYRITDDNTPVLGVLRIKGAVMDFDGWPVRGMEPVDDEAHRIHRYWEKNRLSGALPLTPRDELTGKFFLPQILPNIAGSELYGEARPDQQKPGMPRYRFRHVKVFGDAYSPQTFAAGQEIVFLGWPVPSLEPLNDEARQVIEYYAANKDRGDLRSCPWNWFDDTLYLPDLAGRSTTPPPPMRHAGKFVNAAA